MLDTCSMMSEHAHALNELWRGSYAAGDSVYSTEVQRWCPNRQAFASKQDTLPSGHANTLEVTHHWPHMRHCIAVKS